MAVENVDVRAPVNARTLTLGSSVSCVLVQRCASIQTVNQIVTVPTVYWTS